MPHDSQRSPRTLSNAHRPEADPFLQSVRAQLALRLSQAEVGLASLAREMMAQAAEPVAVIAQQVGFADTSSFFHAFKRWTGKTPAQFRRELHGESR